MKWIGIGIIEHLVLFNKIFNRKGAIGRKAQTVATMSACNHYHLNVKFEDYRIEDMNPENDLEIERHSASHKTQGPEFIILHRYITPESIITTTSILSKNTSNKNLLTTSSKQPRSHTRLQSVQNI